MVVDTPPPVACKTIAGAGGRPLWWTGPELEEGPLPAFFYLALAGEESLCLDPFNQPVAFLAGSGIRCFSIDLPGHGEGFDKLKAMGYWADQIRGGATPIDDVVAEVVTQVDHIVDQGWVAPSGIAVGGLSRGALVASHVAARSQHIAHLLLFSPLTRLSQLKEFAGLSVDQLDIEAVAEQLAPKNIRGFISTNDTRVGTDSCYSTVRAIVDQAHQNKIRSPQATLTLYPPIGHKGHGTPPEIFREGAQWLQQQITAKDLP